MPIDQGVGDGDGDMLPGANVTLRQACTKEVLLYTVHPCTQRNSAYFVVSLLNHTIPRALS